MVAKQPLRVTVQAAFLLDLMASIESTFHHPSMRIFGLAVKIIKRQPRQKSQE